MSADHPPSHHHLGHYVHHPSINQNYNYVNKAKSHYCTYDGCEKAFATVAHMKRHLKTHSGLQPYECQYCSKRFGRSDVRNKHVQSTHEGDKMGTAGRRRRTIAEADGKEKTPEPGDDVEGHSAGGGKARSYSMPGGSKRPSSAVKTEPVSPISPTTPGLPGLASFGSYRPPRLGAFEESTDESRSDATNRRGYDSLNQTIAPRPVNFLNYMPPPPSASSISTLSAAGLPSSTSISSGMSYRSPTNNQLPPIKWDGGFFSGSNDQRSSKRSQDETPSYLTTGTRHQPSSSSSLTASYQHQSQPNASSLPMHSQSLPQTNQYFNSRSMLYNTDQQNNPTANNFSSSTSAYQPGHTPSLSHPPSYSLPFPNTASNTGFNPQNHSTSAHNNHVSPPDLDLYIPRTSMYGDGPVSAPVQSDHVRYGSIPDLGGTGYEMARSASNHGNRSNQNHGGSRQYEDYMKSMGFRNPFEGRG